MEHLSSRLSITKQKPGVVERVICLVRVHVTLMKYSFFLFVRFKMTSSTFVGFVMAGQFTT